MGPIETADKVSVLAKFDGGKLSPVLMRWRGRRYWIQKLNLHHVEPQGGDKLHYFAVTTEIGDATLTYSQQQMFWRLVETNFFE